MIHCRREVEAQAVVEAIRGRFEQCHLELHPTKTRIVYCKSGGLLVVLALTASAAPLARAAGVVGSGTPASCTEAALTSALTGGGTVTFKCGGGPVVIPITSTKVLSTSTTIDGTGQQITLDGGGATKMFITTYQLTTGLNVVFRKLTLRNGWAPDQGAAIELVWQAASQLTNLLVEDVTFQNNVAATSHADRGGGAIYGGTGAFTIRRSTFAGNRGGHGGAIYIDGTNLDALTLRRTVFSGNRATNLGGAIHPWMYGLPSALVIEDCTFANNVGTTNGGAIFHMNGRLAISGSIFSGNTVVGQGGALWEGEADAGQTPVSITNSTFSGNSATGLRPNRGSTGLGGAIRDNGSPTATVAPLSGSPAIDAVTSGCPPPTTDQRGYARRYGPRCDTGAIEWRQTADLAAALSGGPTASEGQPVAWTIGVTNAGPYAASGALVTDSFPSTVTGVTWTCVPAGGASCPASGSGAIAASVNLPVGGSLVIQATQASGSVHLILDVNGYFE